MSNSYNVARSSVNVRGAQSDLLRVSFGAPAQNDTIVRDADKAIAEMGEIGGHLALVNGPASLPVAMVLAHKLAHVYGVVACFDPKLAAYVVSIAHGGEFAIGDLIPVADVIEQTA